MPTVADDVIFNGNGASANSNCTITGSTSVLSLTIAAGYTAQITHNNSTTLSIAGNWTMHSGFTYGAQTGTVSVTAASTITSGGKTFPNAVTFSGAFTRTLSGDFTIGGALTTISGTQVINRTTTEILRSAGLTATSAVSGTSEIILTGGSWTNTGVVSNNLTIAGNITISSTVSYQTNTLKYTSGTVTTTSSTLSLTGSCTLDTNGINWNNVTLVSSAAQTYTINSLLTVNGILLIGNATSGTLAGTAGFTAGTVTFPQNNTSTQTFKNGNTYTMGVLNCFMSRNGASVLITSDDATLRANLVLTGTSTVLANFTRINAASGRTIWTFNGTPTDSPNVLAFQQPNVEGF